MADIGAIGTLTKSFSGVWGNKRVWKGTIVIGDGSSTWPTGGLALSASSFSMVTIEAAIVTGGSLFYSWDGTSLHAYTGAASTGADKILAQAVAAVPNETVNLLVIGTGGTNV